MAAFATARAKLKAVPPVPPEIEGVDICTYEPSAWMMAEVEGAIRARRLRGWMKEQVRAAGGEVVECERAVTVGATMAVGCLMHPRWPVYAERMGPETGAERVALQHCLGVEAVTRSAVVTKVRERLWERAAQHGPTSLRGVLRREGGLLIAGEDVEGVAGPEQGRRRVFKEPRFVVVWPKGTEGACSTLLLRGLVQPGQPDQEPLSVRWTYRERGDMWRRGKATRSVAGGVATTDWRGVACEQPVTVVDLYRAVDPNLAAPESTSGLVGMRGSGILALAFQPGVREMGVGVTYYSMRDLTSVVRFYAALMEIVLEWAGPERIDWKGMTEVVRGSVLECLGWREVRSGEKQEKVKLAVGSLGVFEARMADHVVTVKREAILEMAAHEREVVKARAKAEWGERPGGVALGEGLRRAVEEGVLRAGYVVGTTGQVMVLLPRICFTQVGARRVREVVYVAGVYEVPDMWLWLRSPVREEEMLALGKDGVQHPHPHVYTGRGGQICWGRTDGMAAAVEGEISYGQYAVDTLYTKGWREFVDVMVGFFSQWHDTPTYVPLVVQSKWLGEVGSDETR